MFPHNLGVDFEEWYFKRDYLPVLRFAKRRDLKVTVAIRGNSRAVMCRPGQVLNPSQDYLYKISDEVKRIEEVGRSFDGQQHIKGNLDLFRAI